jgi:ferredoxin
MKDDYKKLSHEWGSKRRKADSRAAKSTLKKPTKEELEWDGMCPAGKHGLDFQRQPCDLCAKAEPQPFRLPRHLVNHAIASYDTVNATGVLRLAKALKVAYEELDEVRAQLMMEKIRVRMANPPDKCERCGVTPALRTETHGLFWNGNDWVCDDCAEETQQ